MIKTLTTCLLLSIIKPSSVQFAMPMFQQPQPMFPAPQAMMGPPPGMMAIAPMPAPMIIVPVEMNSGEQKKGGATATTTTTTTTTTTERSIAVAIPVPVPLPVQVAVPAYPPPSFCYSQPRPKNCPPCPPCQCQPTCTPAFFAYCSPCHLKCRCRNGDSVPVPLPPMAPQPIPGPAYPVPAPIPPYNPSVMVVPYPPVIRPRYRNDCSDSRERRRDRSRSSSRSCSDETSSSDSSTDTDTDTDSDYSNDHLRQGRKHVGKGGKRTKENRHHKDKHSKEKHHNKKKKRRHRKSIARNFNNFHFKSRRGDLTDNELVKPMLSYVAQNGEIKLQKRISDADAATLMGKQKDVQSIQVMTGENQNGQSQVLMVSSDYNQKDTRRNRQLIFGNQNEPEVLQKGKKELLFKPPNDRRITNLSLSFHVS